MLPHTRSNRRTIALITAILLLLCQTAFAAQACAQHVAVVDTASVSCHEIAESEDSTAPAHRDSTCEAPALAAEPVNLPLASVTALPGLLLPPAAVSGIDAGASGVLAATTQCRAPPLTVLHCRFLI
jgi:hypothetical protein